MVQPDPFLGKNNFSCIIIGGGICGVSCIESISVLQPSLKTLLISGSPLVKVATGIRRLTETLEEFQVEEQPFDWIESRHANLAVVSGEVCSVNPNDHVLRLTDGREFSYQVLCVCSGAKPKIIAGNNPYVLGIRDTETVQDFIGKLENAKRIVVVGNGGIATELVWELEGVEVIWVVKDASISATFVDAGAAEFFLDVIKNRKNGDEISKEEKPKKKKELKNGSASSAKRTEYGHALGPHWAADALMRGSQSQEHLPLTIEYNCEVKRIITPEEYAADGGPEEFSADGGPENWPIFVELTNGKIVGCHFVVSAIGVTPNVHFLRGALPEDAFAPDGGIKVNDKMQSQIDGIFAAGDACTATWQKSPHWTQMRLWTQARVMGAYAAKCILAKLHHHPISLDFAFELFGHVTRFFGFKVVLLGMFNGQQLGPDYEILLRMTKGVEYVKVVLKNGAVQGALLIGETDLEETMENLILNGTDVSRYGEDLLNPDIDIEDYFD